MLLLASFPVMHFEELTKLLNYLLQRYCCNAETEAQ